MTGHTLHERGIAMWRWMTAVQHRENLYRTGVLGPTLTAAESAGVA